MSTFFFLFIYLHGKSRARDPRKQNIHSNNKTRKDGDNEAKPTVHNKKKKSSSEIPKCKWPSTYFFVLPILFASFNYTHRLENKWTRPHIHKITGSRAIEFHIIRNQTVGEVEKDTHTHTQGEFLFFFFPVCYCYYLFAADGPEGWGGFHTGTPNMSFYLCGRACVFHQFRPRF